MRQFFAGLFALSALLSYNETALADPWFTGPILAPAGRTIPNGHTNLEIYGFYTVTTGSFNDRGQLVHMPTATSTVLNPLLSHGITDKMDIQFSLPYAYNQAHATGPHHHMGDTAVTLGYQLIEQKDSKWRPNLRLSLQQIIPTGEFTELDPSANGTDASGLGSYQTAFGLNFQHLIQLGEVHYLRTRLVVNYVYASSVAISGLSSYGGTEMTLGNIKPGDMWNVDLAGEFTLTQHWVAVMETFIAHRQATNFTGFIGNNADDTPGTIGRGPVNLYTLAPAIEYNFTPTIGIIAGPWFTVAGRNTSYFTSYVVALNAYW